MKTALTLITITALAAMACNAGESMDIRNEHNHIRLWAELVGNPVDIAPWTYVWRADRAVQEKPEAYFTA